VNYLSSFAIRGPPMRSGHQQVLAVLVGVIDWPPLRVVATCEPGGDRARRRPPPYRDQLGSCLTVLHGVGARTAAARVVVSTRRERRATRRRWEGVVAVDEVIAGAAADHIAAEVAE
jgi:hypothetical protein